MLPEYFEELLYLITELNEKERAAMRDPVPATVKLVPQLNFYLLYCIFELRKTHYVTIGK